QPYGQREPGRGVGTPVTVLAGQALKDIVFRLVPAAAISGRVSDATGEPLLGVNILILRASYDANGKRRLQIVGGRPMATDDRGEYRAYLLAPGRYYVEAVPNLSGLGETSDGSYVPTYYPDIKGDGGTDYVAAEAATGRVFVSRATHMMVVEGA